MGSMLVNLPRIGTYTRAPMFTACRTWADSVNFWCWPTHPNALLAPELLGVVGVVVVTFVPNGSYW